ncbi:UNKNOWN [Stylonychia lemnae]|uniref:Nbr1 FW domain-containing protein n=1 Tax=Stylonychia lemnae TaxID=5949 RepID=A0A078AVK7_STYLE|nr:UNKNOWN [Stylonychia lemnae]|eukprot:CDW86400.1 UNKNOWN [Stylonychia lemnae]
MEQQLRQLIRSQIQNSVCQEILRQSQLNSRRDSLSESQMQEFSRQGEESNLFLKSELQLSQYNLDDEIEIKLENLSSKMMQQDQLYEYKIEDELQDKKLEQGKDQERNSDYLQNINEIIDEIVENQVQQEQQRVDDKFTEDRQQVTKVIEEQKQEIQVIYQFKNSMAQVKPLQDFITKTKTGQEIYLRWQIKNKSKKAWPQYPYLKNNSENITEQEKNQSIVQEKILQPGESYEIVHSLTIPLDFEERLYTLNMHLIDPLTNERFGDQIIAVIEIINQVYSQSLAQSYYIDDTAAHQHEMMMDDDQLQESVVIEEDNEENLEENKGVSQQLFEELKINTYQDQVKLNELDDDDQPLQFEIQYNDPLDINKHLLLIDSIMNEMQDVDIDMRQSFQSNFSVEDERQNLLEQERRDREEQMKRFHSIIDEINMDFQKPKKDEHNDEQKEEVKMEQESKQNNNDSNSILATQGMNSLLYNQIFGFSAFSKRLGVYSYKLGRPSRNKNPHAIPYHIKQQQKLKGYKGAIKIREMERNSDRPFGRISKKGNFIFQIEKVPFFNVPDLANFKLLPYVSHTTPKVNENDKVKKQIKMTTEILEDIEVQIKNAPKGSLVPQQNLDPVSQLQRKK